MIVPSELESIQGPSWAWGRGGKKQTEGKSPDKDLPTQVSGPKCGFQANCRVLPGNKIIEQLASHPKKVMWIRRVLKGLISQEGGQLPFVMWSGQSGVPRMVDLRGQMGPVGLSAWPDVAKTPSADLWEESAYKASDPQATFHRKCPHWVCVLFGGFEPYLVLL